MGYENNGKNLMLDALGEVILYIGLLDENDTELTGGDPAYERKAVTWKPASEVFTLQGIYILILITLDLNAE